MKLSWFFVILLLALVAIFSVQNAAVMTVHFLGWSATVSAAIVIQLAALLGAVVGLTVGALSRRRPKTPAPAPSPIVEPRRIETPSELDRPERQEPPHGL